MTGDPLEAQGGIVGEREEARDLTFQRDSGRR